MAEKQNGAAAKQIAELEKALIKATFTKFLETSIC